ncbi:unnamed protein product [Chrysodeixis includens]|uniref:XRCC4 N-terminal domain-containing protein n=1 Tax=Chrysodeixis includens TaxID=689277 RepID=A0A9N8Q011_CHRIL|nr:unnamed protein product [Chrysodeixis includens]
MDLDEAITVTKLALQGENCYLMIGWQSDSFEVYLFNKDKLWKGRFSPNRLVGFSRNLHKSEVSYFNSVKKCLSQPRDDYCYELKSGFFYWKRKVKGNLIIEGFLPMEVDPAPKHTQPDLTEVLLALNKHLKQKVNSLQYRFETVKNDYQKCLKDTEEFLNLKIEMEKALCDKFLSLLSVKKSKVNALKLKQQLLHEDDLDTVLND